MSFSYGGYNNLNSTDMSSENWIGKKGNKLVPAENERGKPTRIQSTAVLKHVLFMSYLFLNK